MSGRPWVLRGSLKLELTFWEEVKSVLPWKPAPAGELSSLHGSGSGSHEGISETVSANTETSPPPDPLGI